MASKRFLLQEKPQLDDDAAKTDPLNQDMANLPDKALQNKYDKCTHNAHIMYTYSVRESPLQLFPGHNCGTDESASFH